MKAVADDFKETYPDVTVELRAISESEYVAELEKAAESNALPTLFESDSATEAILEKANDITNILKTEQASDCYFLKQYKGIKQIPLAIEVPAAYIITNGVTAIEYEKQYFSKTDDFGTNAKIALDSAHKELISKNFKTNNMVGESEFLNNESNTCAVMLSSTMSYNKVRETLTAYEKTYVFPDKDKINCNFIYKWSVGDGEKEELRAGEKLLAWMLGHSYQNMLMISNCNDGQIPVNKECFDEKISQKHLSSLKDIYKNFVFE